MSNDYKILNKTYRSICRGLSALLLLNLLSTSLFAQNVTITGTVKDEKGGPIPGAVVQDVNSKIVTSTKANGTYELKNVSPKATLRFSYVGFKPVYMPLKSGEKIVDVILKASTTTLAEVSINNGLYKRPVGNFTGAAKAYSGEELKMVNPRNVIQALAAIDPSVRLTENNILGSDPNQLPVIQIRGQNNLPVSASGNPTTGTPVSNGDMMSSYLSNPNEPLLILDGFQTTMQTIYDMDINLIASITVLKDAAATVAYGSKAANGVIVVETKQPLPGKIRATYSVNFNIELPDLSSYDLLDAEGILEAQRLAGIYSDENRFNDIAKKQWYNYRLNNAKRGVNTYWLSQPVQIGFGTNHSFSLSGGAGALRYGLNLNYNNSEGVMKESSRSRYNLSYNLSYVVKNVKFDNRITLGYTKGNNTPWGSFRDYADQFPFFRNKDEAGNIIKILEPNNKELEFDGNAPGGTFTNPSYNSTLNIKDYSANLSIGNNTNVEWTIMDGLQLRGSLGWNRNVPESESFYPADHTSFVKSISIFSELGSYGQLRGINTAIDGKINGSYHKKMGNHSLFVAVGGSFQQTSSQSTRVGVTGIPIDYLSELGLANGFGLSNTRPLSNKSLTKSLSNYLSLSYNYDDRYTAEFTFNQSGSSQFGSNNKLAPFYGGGVAWNITNEDFFKENDIVQSAKLRASFGITGNQNFSPYMSTQVYEYSFINDYRLSLGALLNNYANPDLKWQQTLKQNLGLTLGLFKGKINVGMDLFRETTDNLILPLDVAPSTGFVNYQDNLGGTRNQGYEVSISSPLIKNSKRNIFWTVGFNTGHYTNVITRLSPAIEAINKANNSSFDRETQKSPLPRFVVGQSTTQIWAVPSFGIDPATGKEVFEKLDGSRTFIWDANDKRPIGDANSKFKGGMSSNFTYKNFVLNFNLVFQTGGYMYNQTLVDRVENVDLLSGNADRRVLTDRWKQPGDHSSFKSLVSGPNAGLQLTNATSRFVQKNDFLDITSMTVGYNFPSNLKWVKAARLSTPRIMITQNNFARFATIKTERGTGYPFARSFSFGLSTNF
ncbi:SusC/RagA family TonB-linked outer membrane protein [Pedobacter nyackensis]|uniref:TonB-linked outer membrane protein, SusC/RagA family n=1 Tax=Pedobacter nyackensis TaxID=475255 RepID=A0A1W2CQB7_9SPHI|nr:SusC/RagA family TonB-linked outer membrane protein [Pedobacter nyackensis]SMC87430.1 TonB-linked outer membrane protein, SusC/RagA family [Pedobacter nyackensis]